MSLVGPVPVQLIGNVAHVVPFNESNEPSCQSLDIKVLAPRVIEDDRGWFYEAFKLSEFESLIGSPIQFVQDNQSRSRKDVLRGLHYQIGPMAQGKLVRVVQGGVFDVAVDMRRSSPTFGEWRGVELSADNLKQVWIPPGYAHGFLTMTDHADVLYKVTEYYSPAHERAVRWDDPEIGIEWPLAGLPALSRSDAAAPLLCDAETFE